MSAKQDTLLSANEVMRRVRTRLGVSDVSVSPILATSMANIEIASSSFVAPPPTGDFPVKSQYVVADFLAHDDVAFIVNTYRAVLGREPDDGALQHLQSLRAGATTKIEVLGAVRFSPEGMARGMHIDGLLLPYKLHQWRHIPVAGRVLAWVHSLVRLDRNTRVTDAHIDAVSGDMQHLQGLLSRVTGDQALRLQAQERTIEGLATKTETEELAQQILTLSGQLGEIQAMQRLQAVTRMASAGSGSEPSHGHLSAVDTQLDLLYADFEDHFRGPQVEIRARLEPYLKFVRDVGAGTANAPVLDLGCGRGEWLELLHEAGLQASGVDLNSVFIQECLRKGLDVQYCDAISKLKSLPDASVGVVSTFHLVEHLDFSTLIELVDEASRVLVPGGGFIAETPNPENALVAQWAFYMDPTHRNPLPPQMLRWVVQTRGFVQSDIQSLFEARPAPVIAYVPDDVPGASTINALVKPFHESLDYAIVARKSVSTT